MECVKVAGAGVIKMQLAVSARLAPWLLGSALTQFWAQILNLSVLALVATE